MIDFGLLFCEFDAVLALCAVAVCWLTGLMDGAGPALNADREGCQLGRRLFQAVFRQRRRSIPVGSEAGLLRRSHDAISHGNQPLVGDSIFGGDHPFGRNTTLQIISGDFESGQVEAICQSL